MNRLRNVAITAALLATSVAPAASAGQLQVYFDPTAAGLTGSAFFADALTGGEVSRISNDPMLGDGSFTWHETGYLDITGTRLNGASVVPTGLGGTYTMYLSFAIDGFQPSLLASGFATAATMSLFMVNGASSFGIDGGGNAFVNNGANPAIQIATTTLGSLTTSATVESFVPLALSLSASLEAGFDPTVPGVFTSPALAPTTLIGAFSHPSDGVEVVNGGQAFIVTGGQDVLTFVPEPAGLMVLVLGITGTLAARRHGRQGREPNSWASNA